MDVTQSLSATRFIAALSSLSNANKQPQLALKLIQHAAQTTLAAGGAQSSPQPGAAPSGPSPTPGDSGSVIDISV